MQHRYFPVSTFIEGLMMACHYSRNMQTWRKLIETKAVCDRFNTYICDLLTPTAMYHL